MKDFLHDEKNPQKEIQNMEKDLTLRLAPILMATAGLFTWAIRGSSGFGGPRGCVFAGVVWGITWYLLSKEKSSVKSRRYGMGWTVFAFIIGIGISGLQGWGDITALVRGTLYYDKNLGLYLETPQIWGYFYFFLIGLHWAGTGSMMVAWSGSRNPVNKRIWGFRILSCLIGVLILLGLFFIFPKLFLPEYSSLSNYNFELYPGLRDYYKEFVECLIFCGIFLGAFVYEIIRKDTLNLKMMFIPAVFTGLSWMFLITFWELWVTTWAGSLGISFNWWRCWESTGGGALGLGFGIAYVVCNKKLTNDNKDQRELCYTTKPNGEKLIGVYLALIAGLIYSTVQAIGGWMHIAIPNIPETDSILAGWVYPIIMLYFVIWVIFVIKTAQNPYKIKDERDNTSNFIYVYFAVYLIMRELGLQVTWSPVYNFSEIAFFIYYIILAIFDLTLVLIWLKRKDIDVIAYIKNIRNLFSKNKMDNI